MQSKLKIVQRYECNIIKKILKSLYLSLSPFSSSVINPILTKEGFKLDVPAYKVCLSKNGLDFSGTGLAMLYEDEFFFSENCTVWRIPYNSLAIVDYTKQSYLSLLFNDQILISFMYEGKSLSKYLSVFKKWEVQDTEKTLELFNHLKQKIHSQA